MGFLLPALILLVVLSPILFIYRSAKPLLESVNENKDTLVVAITVTNKTGTRIPDMFVLASSLAHQKDLFWVVVDNSTGGSAVAVADIIRRTGLPSILLNARNQKNNTNTTLTELYNRGLEYVRDHLVEFKTRYRKVVVYFVDVDYAYDNRLWDEYVRKVDKLGVWDVGRPIIAEAKNKTSNKTDSEPIFKVFELANVAFNADHISDSTVEFNETCKLGSPVICFIRDLRVQRNEIQVFAKKDPEDYLVWHAPRIYEKILYNYDSYNYLIELPT